MTETPILETEPNIPAIEPMAALVAAARASGKGGMKIVREILSAARAPGKLMMTAYFYYRLWDDKIAPGDARRSYIGRALEPAIHNITSDPIWWGVFHDKLVTYSLLERAGFPVPETIALYRRGAALRVPRSLPDEAALIDFLREPGSAPFFAKPVTGIRSAGAVRVDGRDAATGELLLSGGRRATPEALSAAVARYAEEGYLFQRIVAPHPEIARLTGGRLAGARLVLLLEKGVPRLYRALLKIPVGGNVADNFWRSGNLVGAIEAETGRITRVVAGVGADLRLVESHPDSGETLPGAQVPDWEQAVATCLAAATLVPQIRMQAWDVILSDRGPLLMEANVGGDFNLPQLAHGHGMLTGEFRAFLKLCAEERGGMVRAALAKIGLDK
ncbi:MAG: hypothetical protein IT557_19005 [Alphaproteobacteria bacterium]|nr:hypothetical protein [Alphaproteobacteria bacterium]